MALSARNQLKGKVKSVVLGAVMAEVIVDIGDKEIVSVITRHSVESLDIKSGDAITAVIKSTEVLLDK
jgi:molybdopterin-binding protein